MTPAPAPGPTPDGHLDALLDLACRLAVAAGDAALAARRSASLSDLGTLTKSTVTDLVTVHDRAAERIIVDGIVAARPDDAIVGEEGTDRPGVSGLSWYVDPIDGTTNFVYDLPTWATSVAAGDEEGMLVGAVYAAPIGELFAGARGRGATLNGLSIRASGTQDLGRALVGTGFSYEPARRQRQAAVVQRLIGSVRDIRRMGAASLDLCYVAAGRFDAYFEEGLNVWDLAAGALIAREAGCRTGGYARGSIESGQIVAAPPVIFEGLSALLADAISIDR